MERRCESRWIMGQRSVAMPSSVSTELRGEGEELERTVRGMRDGGSAELGEVPRERAVMTS